MIVSFKCVYVCVYIHTYVLTYVYVYMHHLSVRDSFKKSKYFQEKHIFSYFHTAISVSKLIPTIPVNHPETAYICMTKLHNLSYCIDIFNCLAFSDKN